VAQGLLRIAGEANFDATEAAMQYTIEARELTRDTSPRLLRSAAPHDTVVEAGTAEEAISRFVQQNRSELVSLTHPARGSESIATVKKDDAVYLLRVYAA
jgi:hypothetical protein